jgi:hypothetical protein
MSKLSAVGKHSSTPALSIVVIVYDMPRQALNTIRSLSPDYQRGVRSEEYEVVVVENRSGNCIPPDAVADFPANVRYVLRDETEPTPVHAVNYGAGLARGENICIMIDGARMVTPGVVSGLLRGHRVSAGGIVTVPGYHIGSELQQDAVESGYDEAADRALIDSVDWYNNGYGLFDVACLSESCATGFFLPNGESNCISMPRRIWQVLRGCDPRFNLRGGGLVNLDLYKRACEFPGTQHVILPGEGTFHQFHGGVTTGGDARDRRQALISAIRDQYRHIRGEDFQRPETQPIYLGYMPPQAMRFLELSCAQAREHNRVQEPAARDPEGWRTVEPLSRQAKTR